MTVRTRFAPSPTGYVHVGNLRTCLYDVLLARQQGGTFVLRVEDTDRERYLPGAVESLLSTLNRMGMVPDEGPRIENGVVRQVGDRGPYVQSERLPIYKEHAARLVADGHAYHCFCSSERLESLRKQQEIAKLPTKYDRHCLTLSKEEVASRLAANEPHVIRLKMPDGETSFDDVIRGRITINNAEIDDQVLIKSDGFPTYHLAVVVDDHLMGITHIIRGEEWISSVPKHVVLFRYFGWEIPAFAHLPLILNPDKSKLSKRQGDVAVEDYLAKGYLPEAIINFIALLGFNPRADQELYSIQELTEAFDLSKINKSGAVFDIAKLDWMNGQYLMKMTPADLAAACLPFLTKAGKTVEPSLLERICTVERSRMTRLSDVVGLVDGYETVQTFDPLLLVWKKADATDAQKQLVGVKEELASASTDTWNEIGMIEGLLKGYIEKNGLQNGNVLWPTRVALSGKTASPSPFELAWAIGREQTLRRLDSAISALQDL